MDQKSKITIKIYVGSPIEYDSERRFLTSVVAKLEELRIPAVVLANVEISDRQVDFIIATTNSISVVEVKSSHLPMRGEINGEWTRLTASGQWQNCTNGYQQAARAKNRLRDAMQARKSIGNYYPDAYVVFASAIPLGSQITDGNFKVQVITVGKFLGQLDVKATSPWSLTDWEDFARAHSLTHTSLEEAVANIQLRRGLTLLTQYNASVAFEYAREGVRWLPESEAQRALMLAAVKSNAGCFVNGPSGCGKSLIAKWLTAQLASEGMPTFFLAAKDYAGSWADSLRREIALVIDSNPADIYRAVAHSDLPIFVIVDGINEFGSRAPNALRGIRALARRMGAHLVITGQDTKPEEFEGLSTIVVASPSFELKQRIAKTSGAELTSVALDVIRAVASGIEAAIVGQIGGELKAHATRLLLIDQYIRKRLGEHARAGSLGLRRLASLLHRQVAFSLPESELDDFMRNLDLSFGDCEALFSTGLLVARGGRVSFSHEMLQNACAAFDLAQQAEENARDFGQRLATPILEPIASDVIAAIEDASVCRKVLQEVTSPSLLADAASGRLGSVASSVVMELLRNAFTHCIAEIQNACLELSKEGDAVRIGWAAESKRQWSSAEKARLQVIGRRAALGLGIGLFMDLCAEMDSRLLIERRRFADFARKEQYPLRSQSFALTYFGFGEAIGFTIVARSTQRGLEPSREEETSYEFRVRELTSGQLHFYLERHRQFTDLQDDHFADDLAFLFRERFAREPYHVQLALLSSVMYVPNSSREIINQLVDSINALDVHPGNWAISSSIVDALKSLDAIKDDSGEQREKVRREIAIALSPDDAVVDKDLALSIYVGMFDHPYDWIYAEEVYVLDESSRNRLYCHALGASDISSSMSLGWLAREVASKNRLQDAEILRQFTCLPSRTNPFVQEEWVAFVVSTRFLGRHHVGLFPIEAKTLDECCLVEIRALLYAIESKRDIDLEEASVAWSRLHDMPSQLLMGCVSEINRALLDGYAQVDKIGTYPPIDLANIYATDFLRVSRRFIDEGKMPQFFHQGSDHEKVYDFVFEVVSRHGDRSDVERLRARTQGHQFARHAVAALRRLDVGSE
jgi:hypothetical protein